METYEVTIEVKELLVLTIHADDEASAVDKAKEMWVSDAHRSDCVFIDETCDIAGVEVVS